MNANKVVIVINAILVGLLIVMGILLFEEQKSCDEFTYGTPVKVIEGFFIGMEGNVMSPGSSGTVYVEINNLRERISCSKLEILE